MRNRSCDCGLFSTSERADDVWECQLERLPLEGPEWIKSKAVRFDVVAQAAAETPREQLMLRVQALRAERQTVVDFTGLKGTCELKLEARKGPFDVLVIDYAEKIPTEN